MRVASSFVAAALALHATPVPPPCSAPPAIGASAITLVGEIHGTNEAPAWVANVACGLARQSEVVVALEVTRSEQDRIDAFMKSAGTPADRAALIAGPFWKGQDGRASEAMVALIVAMRDLSARGSEVSVAAVDDWRDGPGSRDAAMASAIRQLRTDRPRAQIIALMGNRHAPNSARKPSKGPIDQPVGYLLRDLQPYTVLADFHGGVAWACSPGCGPLTLRTRDDRGRPAGFYADTSPRPGYQAAVDLGPASLSPPVSQRAP